MIRFADYPKPRLIVERGMHVTHVVEAAQPIKDRIIPAAALVEGVRPTSSHAIVTDRSPPNYARVVVPGRTDVVRVRSRTEDAATEVSQIRTKD